MNKFTLSINYGPISALNFNLGSKLSDYLSSIFQEQFGDPKLVKRIRVITTELFQNAIQHGTSPTSSVNLSLKGGNELVVVSVKNIVKPDTATAVQERIKKIMESEDIRAYLRKTIEDRRSRDLRGGIGLIRMRSENDAALSSKYDGRHLTISAVVSLNTMRGTV